MEGWCMSNKILALCQGVLIMAIFCQLVTSFCPIWKTYGPILLIFRTVIRYHTALLNIKHILAPCKIMVIMTYFHSTLQYLQDTSPDFVHILYSDEVQWRFDAHEQDFGFVPWCGNYCSFASNVYIKLVGDVYSDEYLFRYRMRRGERDVQ